MKTTSRIVKRASKNPFLELYFALIVGLILILSINRTYAQSYTVNLGGYSGSASYSPQTYSISGSFGNMSGSSSSFITTSVPTSFSITFYSSFYGNTCTLSGTVSSSSICGGSGSYNTTTGSCGGGGNSAGITLSAGPNLSISGSASGTYCASQKITINASSGFGSYTWYYKIASGSWTPFVTNTQYNYSFGLQDVFGANYASYFNQNIYIGYGIAGCGLSKSLPSAFTFMPDQVTVNSYTTQVPSCVNGSDGSVNVLLYSRTPLSGESFSYEVHTAPSVGPSTLVSSTALSSGTYYVLAVSNQGGCGAASFTTVVLPPGPRTALTSSAAVTSNHNGAQISCVGSSDGEITITQPTGGNGSYKYFIDNVQKSTRVNAVGAGTYSIRVEDGCSIPNTFTTSVTVSSPPALVLNSLIPSYCNSTTTSGQITVTKTGGTGSLSDFLYSYDGGGTFVSSATKSGLTTGITQTVVVKDINGCQSLPQEIIIPNPLSGTSAVTNPACGTGTGKIMINGVTGGNGSYRYSLNGATAVAGNLANGHEFTGLLTSTNSVVISDVKGCTSTPFNGLEVTVPAQITVTASSITPESCVGKNDGSITVTALNAVGSVKYSLNGGVLQTSNVFSGQSAGSTYYVTVKEDNANGCTGTLAPITIGQITPLSGIISETQSILCYGDTGVKGAALDLTPSGGTPDVGTYVYQWTKGGTLVATTQDLTGIPAGTYSVTITDKKLCSTTLPNIVVSQPALLTSSISKTDVSCNPVHGTALSSNGAINLTPAGGTAPYQYVWSNNATSEDLSGLIAGAYDVTITDINECVTNNSTTLIQPNAVVSAISSSSDVTCNGLNNGSITIASTGGSAGFSYSSNGTTWQLSPVFVNLSPANYTITTKDQKGCSAESQKIIAEPASLVVTVNDIVATTCGNNNGAAQASVTGGTGTYTYTWTNSFNQVVGNKSNLTGVPGDAYSILVKDQNNCSDSKSALIANSNGAQIQINSIDQTTCHNTSDGKALITVTNALSPFTITWNNNETGLAPTALLPGDNIVRVSDANNCVAVKLVQIPAPDAMEIDTKVITPPSCSGSIDAGIALTMKGGNGNYTYAWANGINASSINNVAAGDYGITVTDIKNCTYTSSIKIEAVPELKLSVVNEKLPTCFDGNDGALTVGATGGNGAYNYQWGEGTSSSQLSNIKAGSYTVRVTDLKGCNLTSSFNLNNPAPFTINIEDKTICVGQKFKIASDVVNGTYLWTSTKGFASKQQEVTLTEPDTYTLAVMNAQGCSAQDSFELRTSTDLLHADLLMISEAYEADTIVVIDLSWPLPDATTWIFPSQASVVEQNNDLGYAFLKFSKSGQYDVAIRASLGECVDTYSQAILIKEGGVTNSTGRQSAINVIQYFEVYPNPNKGDFKIVTDLAEAQPVRLMLINTEGNKILINQFDEGKDSYHWNFSLPDLTQGTYFLVLKAGKETKAIRMMKL